MNRIHTTAFIVLLIMFSAAQCFSADAPAPLSTPNSTLRTPSIDEIRQANQDLYTALESFVCAESMQRFKGRVDGRNAHQVDTVTAKVSFENGVEQYTNILENEHQQPSISSLAGAWSTGEFGTLLGQTKMLLETLPVTFENYGELEGSPVAVYSLDVSEENSPWDLVVRSQHFRIPFRTDLWVSRTTGQVLKIERTSTDAPSQMGISQIRWGVTLQPVQISDKTWLLPKTGIYEVAYEGSDRREWNSMTFSEYHRYGSEATLRFQ